MVNKAHSADQADEPAVKIKPHIGSRLDASAGHELNSPTTTSAPNDDSTSSTMHVEDTLAKQRRATFATANPVSF